jgi:hypothetical protein
MIILAFNVNRGESVYTDARFSYHLYLNGNTGSSYATPEEKTSSMKSDAEVYWKFVWSETAVTASDTLIEQLLSDEEMSLTNSLAVTERCIAMNEGVEYKYYTRGILFHQHDRHLDTHDTKETCVLEIQCPKLDKVGVGKGLETQTGVVLDGALLYYLPFIRIAQLEGVV